MSYTGDIDSKTSAVFRGGNIDWNEKQIEIKTQIHSLISSK